MVCPTTDSPTRFSDRKEAQRLGSAQLWPGCPEYERLLDIYTDGSVAAFLKVVARLTHLPAVRSA